MTITTWFDMTWLLRHDFNDMTITTWFDMTRLLHDFNDMTVTTWFDMTRLLRHGFNGMTVMTWFDMTRLLRHDFNDMTIMTWFDMTRLLRHDSRWTAWAWWTWEHNFVVFLFAYLVHPWVWIINEGNPWHADAKLRLSLNLPCPTRVRLSCLITSRAQQ